MSVFVFPVFVRSDARTWTQLSFLHLVFAADCQRSCMILCECLSRMLLRNKRTHSNQCSPRFLIYCPVYCPPHHHYPLNKMFLSTWLSLRRSQQSDGAALIQVAVSVPAEADYNLLLHKIIHSNLLGAGGKHFLPRRFCETLVICTLSTRGLQTRRMTSASADSGTFLIARQT